MSDVIQKIMEGMIPDFEELQTSGMFTEEEVQKIIKTRREHEYSMRRQGKELVDFMRAIEFELNLSYLIQHRGSRLKRPSKTAYPSVLARLHNLFHGATRVFKSNLRLWFLYIDFATRVGTGKSAGRIFAEVLALHPNVPALWISASSWEYFTNNNISAARTLLQRSNRMNPTSQEILLEYCRLELAYREKVAIRMDLFGVSDTELQEAAVPVSDSATNEPKGALETTAEEFDKVTPKTKKNPFFEGAIPLAVFRTAVKLFPQDSKLRMQFAIIIGSFADTERILDQVYESIEADFGAEAAALAFVARRPYDNPTRKAKSLKKSEDKESQMDTDEPDVFAITNNCVANFERSLSSHASAALYEYYTNYLLEILDLVDPNYQSTPIDPHAKSGDKSKPQSEKKPNEALTSFLRRKIQLVFKEAFANGLQSEALCTRWVDFLLAVDRLDDALETVSKYANADALASNPVVQCLLFSLVGQVSELPKDNLSPKAKKYCWTYDETTANFAKALKAIDLQHPASGDLFILYWNFLLASEANAKSADADENDKRPVAQSLGLATGLSSYRRTLRALKGDALQTFKLSSLQSAISRYNDGSEASVAVVRGIYKIGLESHPTTVDYYLHLINYELALNTAESLTICRRLFEAAVSDHGAKSEDLWLKYVDWESALGEHAKASDLFRRAKRTLNNPDVFVVEFNKRRNEQAVASSSTSN